MAHAASAIQTLTTTHSNNIGGSPCTGRCACVGDARFADDFANLADPRDGNYRDRANFSGFGVADVSTQTSSDRARFHLDRVYVVMRSDYTYEASVYDLERTGADEAMATRDYTALDARLVKYTRIFNCPNLFPEFSRTQTVALHQAVGAIKNPHGLFAIAELMTVIFAYSIDVKKHLDQVQFRLHVMITTYKGPVADHPLLSIAGVIA